MDKLNPGEYVIKGDVNNDKEYLHIVADTVSLQQLKYTCPFCWTRYKRNGDPYKNAKNKIHSHGSDSIENRMEPRVAHCDSQGLNRNRKYYQVIIYVTDKTRRI